MREFLKGLFSIGEHKVSTLVCSFMVLLGFVIYVFMISHTVDNNMTTIIITFILSIAGTNGVNTVSDLITTKSQLGTFITQNNNQSPQSNPQNQK